MKPKNLLWLTVVLCHLFICFGERILVLLPLGSKSHKLAVMPVVEALAEKGHQLTIVSGYEPSKKVTNIHEIQITSIDVILEKIVNWYETHKDDSLSQMKNMITSLPYTMKFTYEEIMNNAEFQLIMQERSVDLVLVDCIISELTFPIIEHLQVPFVFHCSSFGPWTSAAIEAMGADSAYASIPFPTTGFDDKMTFRQRLSNIWMAHTFHSLRQSYIFDTFDEYVKKDFPKALPKANFMKEASLVLVNSDVTTDWPRAIPPTVIPIGAAHARPAEELPPTLKTFADEAESGFIVFTLGSIIKMTAMPDDAFQTFRKVFSKIPQRVIWKWEGEIPEEVPPNVMMVNWLPQQDLLGHSNAKLLITHGGMLGTQEAIYHAVPLIGLPFCNDQHLNIVMAIEQGFGLKVDWNSLNEKLMHDTIVRIVNEPSFKGNASRLSGLMRDRLVPGTELAVYWIEHVLRHGDTKYLQLTSKDIPLYQKYLVDVILFFGVMLVVVISSSYYTVHWIISRCLRRNNPVKLLRSKQVDRRIDRSKSSLQLCGNSGLLLHNTSPSWSMSLDLYVTAFLAKWPWPSKFMSSRGMQLIVYTSTHIMTLSNLVRSS